MEFAARPLPPDELLVGVAEQARYICPLRFLSLARAQGLNKTLAGRRSRYRPFRIEGTQRTCQR